MKKEDIAAALRQLGLREGDIVLLHSSLSSLGHVEGGAQAVVEAFLGVLGPKGTLVVPTFGALGVVTDVVRNDPRAVRSIHPLASVAAIGAKAEAICRDHWKVELAHGPDTPCVRIAELGGYVCLLGVDQDRNTTLHTAEELLRLPYLQTTAPRTFQTPQGEVTKSWPLFPGPHRDFIGLDRMLRDSGKMKLGRIGNSVVRLIKSRDLIDLALEAGRRDPAFMLCDNPNCQDCVSQRAALRRDRFSRESFRLAAAGSLAGRYVPEMIENCRASGVEAIELDVVQGMPVQAMPPEKVLAAVDEIRRGGCEVVCLRGRSVSDAAGELLKTAKDCAVKRVLLPLSGEAAAVAEQSKALDVAVSFFNTDMGSLKASEVLVNLRRSGVAAGFTFSAAGFARLGEKPFLSSYKRKLKTFIDQLDVEDATFDGTPRPLGEGNAEIKEIISILRCANFGGWMTLGAGNRSVGSLGDAVRRLARLLEAM